ncbi:MAG: thioredoxin-like domain-containing protein [Actinomycetota bacterium]
MTPRLAAALACLVVASCSGNPATTTIPATGATTTLGAAEGPQPAPEFPDGLEWLNTGRPLSMAELRGKVVLLDFWTYGCINCIHIIPDIERLEAEYPDELVVIGVHSAKFTNESETANIRNVIVRYGIDHPVVNDKDFAVWRQWGATGWPTLALVDPDGDIVGGYSGEGIYPIFQPVIESLVEQYDAIGTLDRTALDLSPETLPDTVLSFPGKVLADAAGGRLFVADTNHHRVVVADLATGEVLDVAGSGLREFTDGAFPDAAFDQPQGMALAPDGRTLYVADLGNHAIRSVDLGTRTVTTLVGTGHQAGTYPPSAGVAPSISLSSPWDLALVDDTVYVAMAGSHQIWMVELSGGVVEPFAGTGREGVLEGARRTADLAQPSGLAFDGGGRLYFADAESSTIRWVDLADGGEVGLLAGSGAGLFDFGDADGVGAEARLQHPLGVVWMGGRLFIADTYNSKIKEIDPTTGTVTTLSGDGQGWADGAHPTFSEPGGISSGGGFLYVADTNNHVIRRVDPETGAADTLVLYGIERFPTASDDGGITTITLPEATVAPGAGTVTLEVTLPAGHEFNDTAPFSVTWTGTAGVVDPAEGADLSTAAPQFPLTVPMTFGAGSGTLTGDVTVYFCREGALALCLIDRVRLEIPVSVTPGAAADVPAAYTVPRPVG